METDFPRERYDLEYEIPEEEKSGNADADTDDGESFHGFMTENDEE